MLNNFQKKIYIYIWIDLFVGLVQIYNIKNSSYLEKKETIYSPLGSNQQANFGIQLDNDGENLIVGANAFSKCFFNILKIYLFFFF